MQWPANWRGALVVALCLGVLLLSILQFTLYVYVRICLSQFARSHCWLWSGFGTAVVSASLVFLFVAVKRRPCWLVLVHLVCMFCLQTAGWVVAEALEWRTLWPHTSLSKKDKSVYMDVYLWSSVWQLSGIILSAVALFFTTAIFTLGRSLDLAEMTPKSTKSWEFVRVRSSTPKSYEKHRVDRNQKRSSSAKSAPHPESFVLRRPSVVGYFDDITPIVEDLEPPQKESSLVQSPSSDAPHLAEELPAPVDSMYEAPPEPTAPTKPKEGAIEKYDMVAPFTPNHELYAKIRKQAIKNRMAGGVDENANEALSPEVVTPEQKEDHRCITMRQLNAPKSTDASTD